VILYATYTSTNGTLIFGTPVVVVSCPVGDALTRIELVPSEISVSLGESVVPAVWGVYANGARGRLYVVPRAAFSSSNSKIIEVAANGLLLATGTGTATITASYGGLLAQATYFVRPTAGEPLLTAKVSTNGVFEMCVQGLPAKSYTIELSTNLSGWQTITNVASPSGQSRFDWVIGTNFRQHFFRAVELP